MRNLNEFMSWVGVSKKQYVKEWLDKKLIPGVILGEDLEDTWFPESARRPYKERGKIRPTTDANTLRAHIVNAALNKQYISHQMCYVCSDEFDVYINDLVKANLIQIRITDGVTYYDSTQESKNYKINEIKPIVNGALAAISKGIAEGVVTAILKNAS